MVILSYAIRWTCSIYWRADNNYLYLESKFHGVTLFEVNISELPYNTENVNRHLAFPISRSGSLMQSLCVENKMMERAWKTLFMCWTLMMFHGHGFELVVGVVHTSARLWDQSCMNNYVWVTPTTSSKPRAWNVSVQHVTKIFQAPPSLFSMRKSHATWGRTWFKTNGVAIPRLSGLTTAYH